MFTKHAACYMLNVSLSFLMDESNIIFSLIISVKKIETFQFSPAKNCVFPEMTATKKSISY